MSAGSPQIRPFQPDDADDVSVVICRALREVNAADYPSETIERLASAFTPEKVAGFAESRLTFVAEWNGEVVGTASFAKDDRSEEASYVCLTVFVLPGFHGRRIGTALMERVESTARDHGARSLQVPSSITALTFYGQRGYRPVEGQTPQPGEQWVWLHKDLD